ncbi:peptidoglycan-binding domain-containing protein, partial [Mycolicibacterium conceptionense]|uniref:peptidoglycan-binding domain-containing protein n=1 Tax=Mycolicibacterium conceptionense TaxID=451644 RepID=UPI00336AF0BE
LGDNNDRVRSLQQFMNDNFGSYSKLDVDGDFGPATEQVVREFQARVKVAADGIVGPVTLAKLVEHGYVPLGTISTPPPAPAGFTYPSHEEMVKQVWEQMFGPEAKGWPELFGKLADGSRGKFTVEGIADLHKAAS